MFQLRSQNAGVAEWVPSGVFTSARLQRESFQHVGHDTTGVRHVRHMHQRGPASPGVESCFGHDWILRGPLDQASQFDADEKMSELRTSKS